MINCNKIQVDGLSFKQYVAINKLVLAKLATPETKKTQILKAILLILIICGIISVFISFFLSKDVANDSFITFFISYFLATLLYLGLAKYNGYGILKKAYNQSMMIKNGYDISFGVDSYKIEYNKTCKISNYSAIDTRKKYNDIWVFSIGITYFWVRDEDLVATGANDEIKRLLQIA